MGRVNIKKPFARVAQITAEEIEVVEEFRANRGLPPNSHSEKGFINWLRLQTMTGVLSYEMKSEDIIAAYENQASSTSGANSRLARVIRGNSTFRND